MSTTTAVSAAPQTPSVADADTLVRIENLRIAFGDTEVVHGVDLSVRRGEVLAIVGESGSGKSVTTRSLVGLAGVGARIAADRFEILGENALDRSERRWRSVRGRRVGLVLQDALTALDPLRTIGAEVAEALVDVPRRERTDRVEALLTSVGIPDPEVKRRQRSFQLSGGQRQRALIASALAGDPDLIIADEPTTALDVTVQAQVLDLVVAQARAGRAVILVSHDLAVVSAIADRVIVMHDGHIVEQGPVRTVIDAPAADHTRALIAAVPRGTARPPLADAPDAVPVFSANGLRKTYRVLRRPVVAVDDVSFDVAENEVVGVVGESGSGKSTVAELVTGLLTPDAGEMWLHGAPHTAANRRAGAMGLVAQDSVASFDPRYTVDRIIAESVATVRPDRDDRSARVRELLDAVHLPSSVAHRHPRELSGGQRQRVNIARALGSSPRLLVCDEPVSALDISVQAQILDLLRELTENTDIGVVFISHDLSVVRQLCHRLVVLDRGRVAEQGSAAAVFANPRSSCTRRLLDAVPTL
ncbi:MAG: ABC transporter ATP-binding protein [Corynebacteriales bacterium]|nr:ABC transporter ATP-binding protein [Mycobacteriales bacterium]